VIGRVHATSGFAFGPLDRNMHGVLMPRFIT
jgi:hypothetical protein